MLVLSLTAALACDTIDREQWVDPQTTDPCLELSDVGERAFTVSNTCFEGELRGPRPPGADSGDWESVAPLGVGASVTLRAHAGVGGHVWRLVDPTGERAPVVLTVQGETVYDGSGCREFAAEPEPEGCGCASGAPASLVWLPLLALARRRRNFV
jgi:uncharacterized protein (TIGR03382 family)